MYTSVTDQDVSAAIPLLRRSQWNVQASIRLTFGNVHNADFSVLGQIAIAKFFDGEVPDPVEEARAALALSSVPQQSSTRETLLNGSPTFPRSPSSSSRESAPRIVPQSETRNIYRPPLILAVLFAPFGFLYKLVSGSLGLFSSLFPFLPRLITELLRRRPTRNTPKNTTGRRPLSPRDTAARFIREFGEEYGSHSLHFFEDGYAQAYDLAKKDLKFLLVILISPEHDETSTFVRETLLTSDMENFVNNPGNNIILWAGNVQDSEAYQVSSALNCTKFPFACLIAHIPQDSSTAMSTVGRVAGSLPASAFFAKLQSAINRYSVSLERARTTRAEQQATRNLRQEQNSAYERSLANDRERTKRRQEAEVARQRAEQEAKSQAEAAAKATREREQWKTWKAQSISPEPSADVKSCTRISIRLPSGDRIIRRFLLTTRMEELYAFIECHDTLQNNSGSPQAVCPKDYEHQYKFQLVSPMPRVVYDIQSGGTVGERIGRSGNLIVEPLVEADEDN